MERLTEEKQIGLYASLKDKAETVPGAFGTYDCLYSHTVAVTRLKEYEDTGLEPEEIAVLCSMSERAKMANLLRLEGYQALGTIDHLQELAQAEKDGRLVVLPCKPGQTIWVESCIRGRATSIEAPDITWIIENTERFGQEIFLTFEEAEAALKKREEADGEAD